MKLEKLTKTVTKSKKRPGRGYGSGKGGHTSGRGAKGQKARSKVKTFEGTAMRKSLIRRLPMFRGKGKFKSFKTASVILNLKDLKDFPKTSEVTPESLVKVGLLPPSAQNLPIKLLGDGVAPKGLKVALATSKAAAKKITAAGGKIIEKVK